MCTHMFVYSRAGVRTTAWRHASVLGWASSAGMTR